MTSPFGVELILVVVLLQTTGISMPVVCDLTPSPCFGPCLDPQMIIFGQKRQIYESVKSQSHLQRVWGRLMLNTRLSWKNGQLYQIASNKVNCNLIWCCSPPQWSCLLLWVSDSANLSTVNHTCQSASI